MTERQLAPIEPEIAVHLLANDKITDINIDKNGYINGIRGVLDVMKSAFKNTPQQQKIALILISHKIGKPTIELYSNPKIDSQKELHFLKELGSLNIENTKLVDFPILFKINVADEALNEVFSELVLPPYGAINEYQDADLKNKYDLNKRWAINEVLPVLCAFETSVDEQFSGVKSFGRLVSKTDFSEHQNLINIISQNIDYWRANMEMEIGDELIPATKIFALMSQGAFDHAMKYLEIVSMFSKPESVPDIYLSELTWRLEIFNEQLNAEIEKGIVEHEKGNYQNAINIYNHILASYPNSAWTLYELYYAQNALDIKNGKVSLEDRSAWDHTKIKIYQCNPLYNLDVRASNAREGYLLFRRQEMRTLFKEEDGMLNDIYKYADIALDLEIYDFAAQLFWYSFTYNGGKENALFRFLYCIEQLGVKNLKQNFRGDYEKEFKKIKAEKEMDMISSPTYQQFPMWSPPR